MARGYKKKAVDERFWPKVTPLANGCWQWHGYILPNGYSQFSVNRKMGYAHRWSYQWFFGSLPPELDHLCRNRSCVNPLHLEPVTHKENCRRGLQGHKDRIKTHCPRGHAYDSANTIRSQGRRRCLACRQQNDRARYLRLRARTPDDTGSQSAAHLE